MRSAAEVMMFEAGGGGEGVVGQSFSECRKKMQSRHRLGGLLSQSLQNKLWRMFRPIRKPHCLLSSNPAPHFVAFCVVRQRRDPVGPALHACFHMDVNPLITVFMVLDCEQRLYCFCVMSLKGMHKLSERHTKSVQRTALFKKNGNTLSQEEFMYAQDLGLIAIGFLFYANPSGSLRHFD